MSISVSRIRKNFKKRLGQANHYLITCLVGLDYIEKGNITSKPDSFSTSWAPKDLKTSARRSRDFILQSTLGWAVESLEMYIVTINRKPKLFCDTKLESKYDSAGQSIYNKVMNVGEYLKIRKELIGLMLCMITWRNYIFHYDIDNSIPEDYILALTEKKRDIANEFCGLDINRLLTAWNKKDLFTFKEVASLISACHKFVEDIDNTLLANREFNRTYILNSMKEFFYNPAKKAKLTSLKASSDKDYKRFILNVLRNEIGYEKDGEFDDILSQIEKSVLNSSI